METENRGEKVELEESLINAVRERPFLYDKRDSSYKYKVKKRNAWEEIGPGIGLSAEEASKLWNALRGQYTTYLGKLKKPSGSSTGVLPTFRHSKTMQFYQAFYKNYKSGTNIAEDNEDDAAETLIGCSEHDVDASQANLFDVQFENFEEGTAPPVTITIAESATPVTAPKARFAKKRKIADEVDERLIAALEASAPTADEFDHFGANVACRLRKIHSKNSLYSSKLQLEIQTAIHQFKEALHNDDE